MKFVLISDIHLTAKNPVARLDDLVEVQFEKLEYVLKWAHKNGASILQAGDLFDRPRSWTLLPRVMDLLNHYEVPIYCVYGQHDTYFYSEKTRDATSLGILAKAGLVTIIGKHHFVDEGIYFYGASWGEEVPVPKNEVPYGNSAHLNYIDESTLNILVIHAPISTEPLFPNHEYTSAKRFFDKHSYYDLILCGDIHRKFTISNQDGDSWLINTGPMLRMTADQYNFSHESEFVIYDTNKKTISWETIPHKPAEEVLTRKHIEDKEIGQEMLNEFVESLKDSSQISGTDLRENIKKYLGENLQSEEVVEILAEIMQGENN